MINRTTIRCILLAAIVAMTPVQSVTADLGISLRIGQPGFYGEIHLGEFFPAPELIYTEPVIIHRPSVHIVQQPIYLHVPPGHVRLRHRYCYQYNTCNRPVFFVRERWYNNIYVPQYHRHNTLQHRYGNKHADDYRDKHRHKDNYHHYDFDRHDKNDKHRRHDRGHGRKHDD